ncbi:Wzy polymerase domain-containing protein [Marinobacter sp.]|uniref:Wzy polymerase domain-containing protein n=1 Tax=Marinobacter sp. TaxID=50741 RepID=UPI003567A8B2
MIALCVLLVLPFLVPLNLYPLPDFPRQFTSLMLITLFSAWTLFRYSDRIRCPDFLFVVLGFGFVFLFSAFSAPEVASYSWQGYLIFWACAVLAVISGSTLAEEKGRANFIKMFAGAILVAGLLVGCIALARYYGVLRHLLPWISEDGSRLLGPWGQPNLTGLILVLALSALLFNAENKESYPLKKFIPASIFLIFTGLLTGSRAWLLMVVILIIMPTIWVLLSEYTQSLGKKKSLRPALPDKFRLIVIALIVVCYPSVPIIDEKLSEPLIESGFLDRQKASDMLERQATFSSNARLEEWKKVIENFDLVENPFFGNGLGRYGAFSVAADSKMDDPYRNGKLWTHPHNIFLIAAVDWGLFGLAAILCFLIWVSIKAYFLEFSADNKFLLSVVAVIFFQNMLEFSFWYFPFLLIFMLACSLLSPGKPLSFSSRALPRFISVSLVVFSLLVGSYLLRDYVNLSKGFIVEAPSDELRRSIHQARGNPLLGDAAYKLEIYRMVPSVRSVQKQMDKMEALVEWRPEQLFMLRFATLSAAFDDKKVGCERLRRTVELFPDTLSTVQKELEFFSESGVAIDNLVFEECLLSGMASWIESGQ